MSQEMERLVTDSEVRMTPPSTMGGGPSLHVTSLVDLGALAGARGLKRDAVQKFISTVQAVAIQTALGSAGQLLELTAHINQAQINQIVAEVRALPRISAPPSQSGLMALLGRPPIAAPEQPAYVSLDAVLAILHAALRTAVNE